jgi:hypothetical protein
VADEIVRARRKLTTVRRAEFSLRQRLDKIDFELDILQPEIRALEDDAAKGRLPSFSVTFTTTKELE